MHEGHSDSSKCQPDFRFMEYPSPLYGFHLDRNLNFSSFIRRGSVLPQQNVQLKVLVLGEANNFLNDPHIYHC